MKNIVLVTNNTNIVKAFRERGKSKGYQLKNTLTSKANLINDLSEMNKASNLPDILLVTEGFDLSEGIQTWELVINIKKLFKDLRIVYAVGAVNPNDLAKMNVLARLVKNDIYDFIIGNNLTEDSIFDALNNPKTFDQVSDYLAYDQINDEFDPEKGYHNVIAVSSMKPGSGKTFMATNLAIAIAKYGQSKRFKNGKVVRPNVAIVDGDLLNLSVGTTLRVDNKDKNEWTALAQISKCMTPDGVYTLSDEELENLKKFVRSCLTRHKDVQNLYCMAAPNPNLQLLSELSPVHFFFMLEQLIKAFDVIVIDTNSSFDHQTTSASFEIASRIYLLMDMDYNNIRNNIRYYNKLCDLNYRKKLHYVVNKDIPYNVQAECVSDIKYDLSSIQNEGIVIDHRIPLVDPAKIKAMDYDAKILIDDETPATEDARVAILEIANDIWKIDIQRIKDEDEKENNGVLKKSTSSLLENLSLKITNTLNN